MTIDIINIAIFALFGIAVNLAAFAVWKYKIANSMHVEKHQRQYAGALPEHIWKTGLGTALVLIGAVLLLTYVEELTVAHGFLGAGFLLLALGMHELLNFENHRINMMRGKMEVQVTDQTKEKV
jgi:ABC-type uncharacterized transport system permease subunit